MFEMFGVDVGPLSEIVESVLERALGIRWHVVNNFGHFWPILGAVVSFGKTFWGMFGIFTDVKITLELAKKKNYF